MGLTTPHPCLHIAKALRWEVSPRSAAPAISKYGAQPQEGPTPLILHHTHDRHAPHRSACCMCHMHMHVNLKSSRSPSAQAQATRRWRCTPRASRGPRQAGQAQLDTCVKVYYCMAMPNGTFIIRICVTNGSKRSDGPPSVGRSRVTVGCANAAPAPRPNKPICRRPPTALGPWHC